MAVDINKHIESKIRIEKKTNYLNQRLGRQMKLVIRFHPYVT